MSVKDLYSADLLTRFPGYSFTETTVDSMTQVDFEDDLSALVDTSTKLVVDDAYRAIRERQVGRAEEVPLVGPGVWVTRDQTYVQTTDDTQTTVDSITLDDDSVCLVRINVIGIEDDASDRGAYDYTATVYRNGGGATIEGSVTENHIGFSDSNWKVDLTVSGNDAQCSVTGVALETIDWYCTMQYMLT
jgi:hypothetical protein